MEEIKGQIKEAFRECLKATTIKIEERCKGHMSPTEWWLVLSFEGEVMMETRIARETYGVSFCG